MCRIRRIASSLPAGILIDGALGAASPLSMHLVDLNGFEPINDRLGHPAGDAMSRGVARRLEGIAGNHGDAGRLGGDAFAVVRREEGRDRGDPERREFDIERRAFPHTRQRDMEV